MEFAEMIIFISDICLYIKLPQEPRFTSKIKFSKIILIKEGVHHGRTKKNIFVIDDEPDITQLIEYNLKKEGYKTFKINSGLQAIWEVVQQKRPDCILLDIMMPSPDGFEICDFLKTSEDYREIPVILVSAKASPEDIEKGLELSLSSRTF